MKFLVDKLPLCNAECSFRTMNNMMGDGCKMEEQFFECKMGDPSFTCPHLREFKAKSVEDLCPYSVSKVRTAKSIPVKLED